MEMFSRIFLHDIHYTNKLVYGDAEGSPISRTNYLPLCELV